jgi:hypothetical protein
MPQSNIDFSVCYQPVEGGAICGRPAIGMDPETKRPCCAEHAPRNVVRPSSRPHPAGAARGQPATATRPAPGAAAALPLENPQPPAVRQPEPHAAAPQQRAEITLTADQMVVPSSLFTFRSDKKNKAMSVTLSALVYDLAARHCRVNISEARVRIIDPSRYVVEASVTATWWAPDDRGRIGPVSQTYTAVGDLEAERQESRVKWEKAHWEGTYPNGERVVDDKADNYARVMKLTDESGAPVHRVVYDLPLEAEVEIDKAFASKRRHYPAIVATRARRNALKKVLAIPQILSIPQAEFNPQHVVVPIFRATSAPAAMALPPGTTEPDPATREALDAAEEKEAALADSGAQTPEEAAAEAELDNYLGRDEVPADGGANA